MQKLHPQIRKEALGIYEHINNRLFGNNLRLRFSQTLRTFEQQEDLYSLGRTKIIDKNGKRITKVTNAKAGQSMHNYGLALDIVLLFDKDGNGTFETASWDTKADFDCDLKADWTEAANYFISKGWTWGGNWKSFPDYPHFEKAFGHTWRSLLNKYNSSDTFNEVQDGKICKWINL
jgi:peptidoglycan L-alanyl-D-glutamate endopeptidase CwlK